MILDANGIAMVEDTDEIAPINVLLNAMQEATSDVVTQLKADQTNTFRKVLRERTTETPIVTGAWTELGGWGQYTVATGVPAGDISTGSSSNCVVNFNGWARVRGSVGFATNGAGNRGVRIMRNDSAIKYNGRGGGSTAGSVQPVEVEWEGPVTSGDVFTIDVFQSSGSTLNTQVAAGNTAFFIERTA